MQELLNLVGFLNFFICDLTMTVNSCGSNSSSSNSKSSYSNGKSNNNSNSNSNRNNNSNNNPFCLLISNVNCVSTLLDVVTTRGGDLHRDINIYIY